jgi:hypothetical protein
MHIVDLETVTLASHESLHEQVRWHGRAPGFRVAAGRTLYSPASPRSPPSQAKYVTLAPQVQHLKQMVLQHREKLSRYRLWLISSTERGGGVAEMLPRICALCTEVGVFNKWLIIDEKQDKQRQDRFFSLTKRLHNNIHGEGEPVDRWTPEWLQGASVGGEPGSSAGGCGSGPHTQCQELPKEVHEEIASGAGGARDGDAAGGSDEQARPSSQQQDGAGKASADGGGATRTLTELHKLYHYVNCANTLDFFGHHLKDPDPTRDLVIIHDPQPAGAQQWEPAFLSILAYRCTTTHALCAPPQA